MSSSASSSSPATVEVREVVVTVNTRPVTVEGPRTTGGLVKQAAIAQGVQIGPEFILTMELGGGRTRTVGDDEVITVTPKTAFIANAGDDNS